MGRQVAREAHVPYRNCCLAQASRFELQCAMPIAPLVCEPIVDTLLPPASFLTKP